MIEVTQEDIDKGTRRDSTSCPVALAAARLLGGTPRVSMCFISLQGLHAEIPEHAGELIFRFDQDLDVEPFEFEVEFK